MSYEETERAKGPTVCVVGFGNPQRRDDGIGAYILSRLHAAFAGNRAVRTVSCQQLTPELVEEIEAVDLLILVDASAVPVAGGWEWREIEPNLAQWHFITHHLTPSFFLGLADSIYGRHPVTWLVTVQGDEFGMGEGLSPEAKARALRAAAEIRAFVHEYISLRDGTVLAFKERLTQNLVG